MPPSSLQKDDSIIIIGAGVFGLSTALHFAQRGYRNVTVFDKQPYDQTLYDYDLGCDAASADINKIMRCAYGSDTIYQNLALSALTAWKTWNSELASTPPLSLPHGLSPSDLLYVNNGNLSISESAALAEFEVTSLKNLAAAGQGDKQFVVTDPADVEKAHKAGFGHAVDPFNRAGREKCKAYSGILDTAGGLLYADKACLFALHKARQLGVKFIFGSEAGTLKEFLYLEEEGNEEATNSQKDLTVIGIKTADGREHNAKLVIVAAGGWTPTLLPQLDNLCETTAGSVLTYQIPCSSPLFARFSPQNFPSYAYAMRKGASGGIYGFPVHPTTGLLKIGYRGTKYTNPVVQAVDGKERSVPVTRYTEGDEKMTAVPAQAVEVIKKFVKEYMPELDEQKIPIVKSRVCWYNDSFDNHLVVDYVPGKKGIMVATGGSGHAFKYLPVLGKYVVDVAEGKSGDAVGDEKEVFERWKWRSLKNGEKAVNVIGEGSSGSRVLRRQVLVEDGQLN